MPSSFGQETFPLGLGLYRDRVRGRVRGRVSVYLSVSAVSTTGHLSLIAFPPTVLHLYLSVRFPTLPLSYEKVPVGTSVRSE